MNEVILKWLASGTIGLVVCSSLWLAGSVQHEITGGPVVAKASSTSKQTADIHLASLPIERAASALGLRTNVVLK